MAATDLPQSLDGFLPLLSTSDIATKVSVGSKLFNYLEEPNNSIECSDIGMLVDGIVPWLSNSNPKVIIGGIDIISQLINRMKTNFKPFISLMLPFAIDRLGDVKEPIKVKSFFLIMKLMECGVISPQKLFENISTCAFNHKNSNVKVGSMNLLLSTIEEFGVGCVTISKFVPMIIKLLCDPNVQVRQKAFDTLVDLYKHIGEKLRIDLQQKYIIPQSKLIDLMNKFDEAKASGNLKSTAKVKSTTDNLRFSLGNYEIDQLSTLFKCTSGSTTKTNSLLYSSSVTPLHQLCSVKKSNSVTSHTGTVDEFTFIQSFEDVPTLNIFNMKDLNNVMKKLHEFIQDGNEQWNTRVDSLKKIRSLVLMGATKYDEFFTNLRYLEHSFQISLKDLRSQVVRETCITIAFLSQHLRIKFNHFSESIFSNLIDLIPNSAKVIASSGLVAIRFILEHNHAPRIIPIISNSLSSKSKDIRRACCEFFNQILLTWPVQTLERHTLILQESIKKGITDADSNARVLSRKAYWGFCEYFPEQGKSLLNQLEPSYRKALLTNSGSSLFLPKSVTGEVLNLPRCRLVTSQSNVSVRSSSAIDLQAAQRAKTRTEYAALTRKKVNPVVCSQSTSKKLNENNYQRERVGRLKGRVSMSQPTSRSGSPSSKLAFGLPKFQRDHSGIPRSIDRKSLHVSREASREASPSRLSFSGCYSSKRQLNNISSTRSMMGQKMLSQSREVECALTNALGTVASHKSPKKTLGKSSNHQNYESETSSICSESSVESNRPSSDSFYLNKSQNCVPKNKLMNHRPCIENIISNCESLSWNNRKEGLVNLQTYLQENNIINEVLLKRLTDIFTKIFMDSQTKVMSLFLDVLNELIITHSNFLDYWLYILLVKLFNKEGSDILGSVHSKIIKTIGVVRLSFPSNLQLISVFKFLTDPAQTPNAKTKIFALKYITKLAISTKSSSIFVSAVNGKKDYATLALTTMIGWTVSNNIKQGPELRRSAQEAILALYSLNASQITLRLSQLPEEYQDVVYRLIKFRARRSSVDQLMSRKHCNVQSPTNFASPPLQPDFNNTFNSEESYKSLNQSMAEIQNCSLLCYSSEEKDCTSCLSEINPVSDNNETVNYNINCHKNGHTITDGIIKILDDLDKDTMQLNHKKSILNHLKELIRDCPSDVHIKYFKKIIKVALKLLMDIDPFIREESITLITYLVQKPEMVSCFLNFTELIVIKVLNMCCDISKPVVKAAEECSFILSVSLQPETIVRLITPFITAKQFPVNLIAIKMMTKLIDLYGSSPVAAQSKEIMSGLLLGYDNPDSAVRKSAVFCIVSLYKALSKQEFEPLISSLNGAKLKLLNFYIERNQQTNYIRN